MDRVFTLPSFAKINWSFRILGRRADAYHEVLTVLQTVSLRDDLSLSSGGGNEIVLSCDDPRVPEGPDNLIIKAAEALRKAYAIRDGARITLTKRIPIQGGLGGGSSNAAVTLLGLSRLWNLPVSENDLVNMAAEIGADVPFFIKGGRSLATGTGTSISQLNDLPVQYLLIVSPCISVPTRDAFRLLDDSALTSSKVETILAVSREQVEFPDSNLLDLNNDFEPVIFETKPEIERAKNALLKCGALCALLAGSGSSVFGIFEGLTGQTRALETIEAEPGWRIFPCVTISRSEYARAMNPAENSRSF